jgi:hypothetical protein
VKENRGQKDKGQGQHEGGQRGCKRGEDGGTRRKERGEDKGVSEWVL